jgi:hypothetical protein
MATLVRRLHFFLGNHVVSIQTGSTNVAFFALNLSWERKCAVVFNIFLFGGAGAFHDSFVPL